VIIALKIFFVNTFLKKQEIRFFLNALNRKIVQIICIIRIYFGGRFLMKISEHIKSNCPHKLSECTNKEIYQALLRTIGELNKKVIKTISKKKLYYISAEFLIGKLLSNNLINLGIYDEVKRLLEENGKSLEEIEEMEPEPSLGNGGLGRLAACFLDSVATLGLNGDGVGLNYHFGLFRQVFKDNKQKEEVNPWIENPGFLNRTDISYKVKYKDFCLTSRMYDIDVIGYSGVVNKLHLFDVEGVSEELVRDGIEYDKTDIKKNLTLFLYPDDSDEAGKHLRIYQQYFMVSNAAQMIISEAVKRGSNLYDLPEFAVVQINDTHPTLIIPELIRLLIDSGMMMDDAIDVVSRMCAYTNHTILSEALEKWPIEYLKKTVPQLVPIIEVLDDRVRRKYTDSSVHIIDNQELVHMAHIDIHYGFSINGVAALHTEILKNSELAHFYKIYPQKFNNKTNGITFRRWLIKSNPELCNLIDELIGEGYKKDAEELRKLLKFKDDKKVLEKLLKIKQEKKTQLSEYINKKQGIELDVNSIFDIQIKRLHEYKRQQLNALYLINKYLEIKRGKIPKRPITAIFGAKAAPAYIIAQDIIHLILCLGKIIEKDADVSKHLKVVMVENYNVTLAEKLIPACDISEQISLASKEASGTGNMKLMLNGALTLGTEDGANVEIHSLVGDENIYIFGDDSDTVIKRYEDKDYNSRKYYEKNSEIKEAIDFITGEEMLEIGDKKSLERLKNELLGKDWFMTFPDFDDYKKTKERAFCDFENREEWARKMLVNIANAGYFSSDRTIMEYNRDIWKL